MAHHSSSDSKDHIQPQPFESKKPHQLKDNIILKQEKEVESDKDDAQTKTHLSKNMEIALQEGEAKAEEDNGRERLKKHRVEVAGKVWIPDIWGQEELLKDWIDCTTAFDAPLVPSKIMSARTALAQEVRRASNNGGLKLENGF
ncbi:hypothetical protein RIF29_20658 [Crotalaria pallida]|uniref:Protein BIC1 n=1 Tax=Crotalaria pallida TaxID=3830 RepID=A0AAN9F1I2_CROPI